MSDRYPDKPVNASDGEAFARLCVRLHLDLRGEDVGYYSNGLDQLTLGESAAGIEFKHLQGSYTGRFHIEVAERTSLNSKWIKSGIYADERMTRYCCGNDQDIWVFRTSDLRDRAVNATEWYNHPTVRSMVLYKTDAILFYLYRFRLIDGCYVLTSASKIGKLMPPQCEHCGQPGQLLQLDAYGAPAWLHIRCMDAFIRIRKEDLHL